MVLAEVRLKSWSRAKIVVLGVKGSQIRLGINAPKDVKVHREEIYEKINEESSETAAK